MIVLRALEVERFRRHERLARIDFDERFTVVRGANEAGKSTMLQALHYAFFRRSGATGQDIDALATWGTSGLRPCVNVEFAYDREEYRLEKSWGGGGSTQLYKRDGSGRFMPFQTDGADDFVNALFCGEPHGKGFFPGFRAAHLGIGHLLFATQGRLTIADDDRDALNSLTQSELSRIVGTGTKSPAEIGLSRKIGRAYKYLFKDNRGLTVRAESPKLEREIADIDRRLVEAEDEIRAYDAVACDRREKRAELDTLVVACAAAELAVATEAPRLQAAALAKAEFERCEMLLATAKSAYDALVARKRTIATHRETIAALEPDLHRSQTQSIEAHEALARAEAAARAMRSEANAVAARGDGLAVLRAAAHEAERLTEAARERERLGRLREELAEIDGALGSEERRLATADGPSDDVLSSLRAAIDDECRLRGQIEAADIKVRFLAETAQWLHVEDGGRTSERGVAPGEAVEYRNDGALAIVIEHVGRLDVCGPVADLTGLHERLARARGVVAACESRFGSADPYELRERQQAGAQAKQSVRELRRKRAKLLGERTIAEIDARIHALDASATDSVPDLDGLRAALQRAEKANDENQKRARENLSRAADVLAAANARAASASTTLAELEQRVQKPTNFLQQIAPADVSDADREREIEGAFGALDMAKREAARAAEAYAPYRDIVDPASAFATKQRRALELAALVNEVTAEDARLEGRLRSAAGAWPVHAPHRTRGEPRAGRGKTRSRASGRSRDRASQRDRGTTSSGNAP